MGNFAPPMKLKTQPRQKGAQKLCVIGGQIFSAEGFSWIWVDSEKEYAVIRADIAKLRIRDFMGGKCQKVGDNFEKKTIKLPFALFCPIF